MKPKKKTRVCSNCKSKKTYHDSKGRLRWYKNPSKSGTFLCGRCAANMRYHRNPSPTLERQRLERIKNPEKSKAKGREQYQKHKKSYKKKGLDNYYKDPAKKIAKQNEYLATPEGRKKRNKGNKERTERYRNEVAEIIGGLKCKRCKFADKKILHIHHKLGGGKLDRQRGGGPHVYRKYRKDHKKARKELEILCPNCHSIKEFEKISKNVLVEKDPQGKKFKTPYKKRLRNAINGRKWRLETKLKLFDILGGPFCKKCSFDDIRALNRDHIHGGGGKEKRHFKNTHELDKFYVKRPKLARKRLQVLCANHNQYKKIERGEN